MGLILFFVVCALVFLFYKVDKLSREIYSLELDIARLLRERTLDETFRESEGSEGSLKTGNVASANPAGSKSETLRPTNGGADGFADAKNVKTHLSENRRLPMARRQAIRHSSQSICLAAMACLRPQGRAMMKEPH